MSFEVLSLRCVCPTTFAKTWLDVIIWISGLCSVIYGIWQIRRKNEIARAEMLRNLLGEYYDKPIFESIQAIDDGKVVFTRDCNFAASPEHEKSVSLAEPALLFFSNLCYLRETKLLTKKEFLFFE